MQPEGPGPELDLPEDLNLDGNEAEEPEPQVSPLLLAAFYMPVSCRQPGGKRTGCLYREAWRVTAQGDDGAQDMDTEAPPTEEMGGAFPEQQAQEEQAEDAAAPGADEVGTEGPNGPEAGPEEQPPAEQPPAAGEAEGLDEAAEEGADTVPEQGQDQEAPQEDAPMEAGPQGLGVAAQMEADKLAAAGQGEDSPQEEM